MDGAGRAAGAEPPAEAAARSEDPASASPDGGWFRAHAGPRDSSGDPSGHAAPEPRAPTPRGLSERVRRRRPRGGRRAFRIRRSHIKDRRAGAPFLAAERGGRPPPWRKLLAFEAVARGFFRHLQRLKCEQQLRESLRRMGAHGALEQDGLDGRRHKCLDDDGPLSPIASAAEEEEEEEGAADPGRGAGCDIRLVAAVLRSAWPEAGLRGPGRPVRRRPARRMAGAWRTAGPAEPLHS